MHKHWLLDPVIHADYESDVCFRFWTFHVWEKNWITVEKWLKIAFF